MNSQQRWNEVIVTNTQLVTSSRQYLQLHVGERVEYSKRLHSMPEAACTVKKWTPDDELPEARNM